MRDKWKIPSLVGGQRAGGSTINLLETIYRVEGKVPQFLISLFGPVEFLTSNNDISLTLSPPIELHDVKMIVSNKF